MAIVVLCLVAIGLAGLQIVRAASRQSRAFERERAASQLELATGANPTLADAQTTAGEVPDRARWGR